MVLKQTPGYFDVVCDIIHSSVESSNEYQRLLDKNGIDLDYKLHLEGCAKEKNVESKRKQIVEDVEPGYSFCSEEIDPQYELFLRRSKEHGKSYILQSLEYDKNHKLIKYEGDSSSDTECDQEPRRKSREMAFVKNQNSFDSQSTPSTDSERSNRRQTRSQSRIEMESNVKRSSLKKGSDPEHVRMLRSGRKVRTEQNFEDDSQSTPTKVMEKATMRSSKNKLRRGKEDDIIQLDPDYHIFCQNLVVVNNHLYAYRDSVHEVVYGRKGGESNKVKKGHNDEAYTDVEILDGPTFYNGSRVKKEHNDAPHTDVEILDGPTFYKMIKSSMSNQENSSCESEFRQKVIIALRKPFDEEELDSLWNAVEVRKPEERHIDLRYGRERSYAKLKDGKSYLDCYPALRKKLLQVEDDKPKCLSLLRGFFLWLKQPYWFCPWLDDECVAIYPESG